MYYVAHKVSQKYHEASDEILGIKFRLGSNTEDGSAKAGSKDSSSTNSSLGDVCRFLSKEDVSKAIGVEIVRTEPGDNGCSYLAKGTQADMTAKHLKAMVADNGADKKTQEIAEKIAGGMFTAFQAERPAAEQDNREKCLCLRSPSISTPPKNRCDLTPKYWAIWGPNKDFRALATRRLYRRMEW